MLKQIQQLWTRLTARQRLFVGGGTLLTVVGLFALVRTFGTPEYKPLMTGLEPEDAQSISSELAAKKISFEVTPDGKGISVPADQLDAARMEIASEGSPHSGRMGFELFDKSSWGQTEFDEKVNYQRALEGELARTIETLEGVKSARVHLVLPASSVFLDRERAAKASVALRMKRGELSPEQINAIARLVSGAVDDLSPRDVTIIDADSNEPLGDRGGTLEGRELEAELTKRLVDTLGPAVGAENLRASVNVEYDQSSTEESQDKYDPGVSAVLSSQKTSEQVGAGAMAGGVAGAAANVPGASAAPQTAGTDDDSQLSSTENATFGVNKTVLHTVTPAGRIRRITAAILVNDQQDRRLVKGKWVTTLRKRPPAQLEQLDELAGGVLGMDKSRGDLLTVQEMAFDDESAVDTPPTLLEQTKKLMDDFSTPLRYAAMLLLLVAGWALIVRPVQQHVLTALKELPAGVLQTGLPEPAVARAEITGVSSAPLPRDTETARVKRELAELVQTEPASMARTLQTWLREDRA